MTKRTFALKAPSTRFIVKNIAPYGKRIKIFNYPIVNRGTRDLLSIPEISEADIRHSLLKGELITKLRCREIIVVDSDIDLTQYNAEHKAYLLSVGITKGLGDEFSGGGSVTVPYYLHQNIDLIGIKDGVNRIFMTPDFFINGLFDSNEFSVEIRHNGQTLVEDINYILSESGGVGTGYDTITLNFAPIDGDTLVADYVTES